MPPKKPAVTGRKVPAKGPVKPTTGGLVVCRDFFASIIDNFSTLYTVKKQYYNRVW